ncbi:MAG: tripartite tricarboxylate transporter substrate binding protein [Ottowia sp.]|uniref:Bug family tripartite tricarboxylate transporter substrate binding protein n=1 Tax=Ottowia sp. TaxID=1898956 RepID=UPI003C78C831
MSSSFCQPARRQLLRMAAALPASGMLATLGALPRTALAANFPDRPVKFIVPFGAGGNVDGVGRLLGAAMGPALGQPVVVDNRAGAGGTLGAGVVAQGPADGLTLLVGSNGPLTINPFVQAKMPYDPLKDLAPIALVGFVPHVLIAATNFPAKNLQELIALSKKQDVACSSSGIGSATQLTLERFKAQAGARITHVPYRGGSSLVPDLLSGIVPLASMEFSTALPLHKAGKARILAVAGAQRSPLAPDLPTFIDAGVAGFTAQSFVGLLAPARTPADILRKLEATAVASIGTPEMAERLKGLGLQVASPKERTAAGFGEFLRTDYERSREAVKLAGIEPE